MPAPTAFHPLPRSRRWPLFTSLPLALALLLAPRLASADEKAAPTRSGSTTGSTTGSGTGSSVMDGFRSLGQQISDPRTPDRLKAHEQEFEKNVKGTRDQQRRAHPGELRASDATDMASDPKMGGQGKTRSAAKPAPQPKGATKNGGTAAAPPAAKAPPKAPPPAATPAR